MTDLTKLVRKLEWRDREFNDDCGNRWVEPSAQTSIGLLHVRDHTPFLKRPAFSFGYDDYLTDQDGPLFESPEAAQAAANADHAARVVAALDEELLAEVVEALVGLRAALHSEAGEIERRLSLKDSSAVLAKLGAV